MNEEMKTRLRRYVWQKTFRDVGPGMHLEIRGKIHAWGLFCEALDSGRYPYMIANVQRQMEAWEKGRARTS